MKPRLPKFMFKINTVTIRNLMLLAVLSVSVIVVVLTSLAEEAGASSRYYCSSSTITLEVKSPIALPAPLVSPPESGDKPDTVDNSDTAISDDNNPDHRDNGDGRDTAVSDDEENEDEEDQQSDGTETVAVHHNALIISRLTENHSLHTEINVENISSDQVFIDVFSGDQEAATNAATAADTVFISFENENGVVKTVRIGLDEQIDNITVLDGISETQQTASSSDGRERQTVDIDGANEAASQEFHLDSSLELEQIRSPVIIILSDTNERVYFSNGSALIDHVFQEQYRIESVRAVRDGMEIWLIKK